ncbi:hypothetical protein ScPMuIL_011404 [Solemya velum]
MASLNTGQTSAAANSTETQLSASTKNSVNELVEQIRLLEAEGNVLRSSPTFNSLGVGASSFDLNGSPEAKSKSGTGHSFTPTSPGTLSALVDISSEQKTISDLRTHLDAQRRETERLHQQLIGDYSTSGSSNMRYPQSAARTGFSTVPTSDLFSARRLPPDYVPPSHMEKALKESQEQVSELRRRLMEANDVCEQQKRQFRTNVEDLKSKLHDTVSARESVFEIRQKEMSNQDVVIDKLQASIQQFQEKCKAQEEALLEAKRKMESYHHDNYITETALNQIRLVMSEMERKRGRSFFESDPVGKQGPAMLVHTVERCLQEINKELEEKTEKLQQLESEIEETKRSTSQDKEELMKEHQQKITLMTNEHEKQINAAVERATNSRKQAANLQSQMQLMETQHEQQMKMKEEMVTDMENKIRHLKEEYGEDRVKWQEKRDAIEASLDDAQRELAQVRLERDEALKHQSALEAKLEDCQIALGRIETELTAEREKNAEMFEKESALKIQKTELENKVDEKQRELDRVESMLEMVKQECNTRMTEKVTVAEKHERDKHMDQISTLSTQLNTITEKCSKVTLDMELARIENNNLKQQIRETTDKLDTNRIRLESLEAEKNHSANMLSDKTSDMDRLSQERDYYFNLVEKRNEEVADMRSQKEKLAIQLEEKEKNITMLQQQSSNVSHLLEANSRTSDVLREEKEKLMKLLNEKTIAIEELKAFRENTAKKMKIREKRVKDLELEKQKNAEEAQLRHQEMGLLQEEKDNLYKELKESRYEVATITEERDTLKRGYSSQRGDYRKEISRLHAKLKNTEHDLKLATKTLRSKESVDNQAVRVADKVQKQMTAKRSEMDSLNSKVRWVQDKLESVTKERNALESDKEKLKSSLNKALLQNQKLASDIENGQVRHHKLCKDISSLEASLEKANMRNATSNAHLEQFEQELMRLKLIHQLDLKEAAQRNLPANSYIPVPAVPAPSQFTAPTNQPVMVQEYSQPSSGRSTPVSREHQPGSGRSTPVNKDQKYRDVGDDLKALLNEMRSLISDQKDAKKVKSRSRRRSDYVSNSSTRRPLIQSNVDAPQFESLLASDLDYHSDTEIDQSYFSNGKSFIPDWSGSSSLRGDRSRARIPECHHRRSRSVDMSSYRGDNTSAFRSGLFSEDFGQQTRSYNSAENTANSMTIRLVPDTEELCKRLEAKIESLSKMGGHLQKENKEMSQLIKTQGKKLKKVRESEKHMRYPTR